MAEVQCCESHTPQKSAPLFHKPLSAPSSAAQKKLVNNLHSESEGDFESFTRTMHGMFTIYVVGFLLEATSNTVRVTFDHRCNGDDIDPAHSCLHPLDVCRPIFTECK